MTQSPSNSGANMNASAAKTATAADTKQIVLEEIGAKWGKFSEGDPDRAQEFG